MRSHRPAIAGAVIALLLPLLAVVPASAGAPVPDPIQLARDWLVEQQEPDGGFELAGFEGFETPDAILAIATAGQTGSTWSTAEALAAVQAVDEGGVTALDWADDFVDGASAAQQAKVALLIALPLGIDPATFDPKGNGAADLTAEIDTIDSGLFNSFLLARILEGALGESVAPSDVNSIKAAQHSNGGWSFDAVKDGATAPDVDTTGFALLALMAADLPRDDAAVVAGAAFLLADQDLVGDPGAGIPPGGWLSFGSPDPNATTIAVLGLAAAGEDPLARRADPDHYLLSRQSTSGPDTGRIQSPNDGSDGSGVNTFATAQTIQSLALLDCRATWLPASAGGVPPTQCFPPHDFNDVTSTAWNDRALRWLDFHAVASGFPPDGDFRPTGVFNRAQASLWFSRFFPEEDGADHSFPDVDPWFESGARFIGNPGWPGGVIATGFPPDGEFRGAAPFNRGQAIAWMWKVAGRPDVAESHGFEDGAAWIDPALNWAKEHRIVTGFDDNTFRAGLQINRGQGAFWFYNLAATPEAWAPTISLPSTIVHTPPAPP